MVDDRPPDSDPLPEAEVARRVAVLEHNLRELRAAARTLAREHGEGTDTTDSGSQSRGGDGDGDDGAAGRVDRADRLDADRFEALDRALEDAEAALPEPGLDAEETRRAYRTVLHRLQDIRGSFDRAVVAAVDETVGDRLERWE